MAEFTGASAISPGSAWPLIPTLDPGRSQVPVRASPAAGHLACHWSCAQSHVPGRGFSMSLWVWEVRSAAQQSRVMGGGTEGKMSAEWLKA